MAAKMERTKQPGVYRAHTRACVKAGAVAKCDCPYLATAWSAKDGKNITKQFPGFRAACDWRSDAKGAIKGGKLKAPTRTTVQEAADALIAGMRDGSIYHRKGEPYKPSAIRSYERVLRLHVLPTLGHCRLSRLERREVQAFVESMNRDGYSSSTVKNALDPLRVICRRALSNGELSVDPTNNLALPQKRAVKRDRVVTKAGAKELIEAVHENDRAYWALMFYTGMRRGEVRALRWSDVDLTTEPALIRVRRTWDDNEGEVSAKTESGERDIPLSKVARGYLVEHGLTTGRAGDDLVLGRTATAPFVPSTMRSRAYRAWGWKQVRITEGGRTRTTWVPAHDGALQPIAPHEARHTAASHFVEGGLNDVELTTIIGHSSPTTTKTIYAHLFSDSGASMAAKMDAYHEEAGAA